MTQLHAAVFSLPSGFFGVGYGVCRDDEIMKQFIPVHDDFASEDEAKSFVASEYPDAVFHGVYIMSSKEPKWTDVAIHKLSAKALE